ncbi:class I SAM-dependent methyltransferase [Xanthomonas albilineans]|uniref:Putative sam-dependent methyltransferase protein n=1 Tax=Xanthomonas albilineans (strain GPE PC73 / CFBP 7063) TaxID=380358 RepID=D2U9I8_XANAP|nr:class I SAM-dependent methyltransferase [Xanthomonas albilineans]QHQ29167.1 putative sam-dependent methyltransferase protein [Xanthomonas albilineans]CBA16929.1 putative sam-dependent methyltransferase protein [Xanthomonas albilineans GPE PC73]
MNVSCALRAQLQRLPGLVLCDGVLVQQTQVEDPFEQRYLAVRHREGRLYSDEQVRALPYPDGAQGGSYEWRVRAESCRRLLRHLRARGGDGPLLEVGCGNGWLSRRLAVGLRREVCGVDVNRVELAQAARVFAAEPRLSFVAGDIHSLPLPRQGFDVAVLPACLQYFADPRALIARVLSLLHADGELHIIDSPLYADIARAQASAARSLHYFTDLGCAELAQQYHQHPYAALDGIVMRMLFDPRRLSARCLRALRWRQPHFPWLCIRTRDNLALLA